MVSSGGWGLSHGRWRACDPAGCGVATPAVHGLWAVVFQSGAAGVFGGEAVDAGARTVVVSQRTPALPEISAARGGGRNRQNSLSCAPCCAALSLSEQFQFTNLRMRDSAGKGMADERHPAELSSTYGVCRGRRRDRFGALDRSLPRRLPAARSGKALRV